MSEVKQGRPSKYKEEYLKFARNMALMRFSDEEIAFVLGVDLVEIAQWAWDSEEFFNAITPNQDDFDKYEQKLLSLEIAKERRRKTKREWQKKKREQSSSFRIEGAIRARMNHALKGKNKTQSIRDLPYTTQELMSHLESLFTSGMNWDNYGKWHVDHIKPCALFNHSVEGEFQECWALLNLQPLWARENSSKGCKYDG